MIEDTQSPNFEWLEDLCVGSKRIFYREMPIFRLTPDFERRCYDGRGNRVAIEFNNGLVSSLDIDRRRLRLVLKELAHNA